jgi:hypothetical protein
MATAAQGIWDIEWLNANSQRRYPLRDDATRADTNAAMVIPDDFMVDLLWPVQAGTGADPTLFHIYAIDIFGTGVKITLGYDGSPIGETLIDTATFVPNKTYVINGLNDFEDSLGKVVIGTLNSIQAFAGHFEFDAAGAGLQPTVIKPNLRGVNALFLQNGQDISDAIQGDVVFEAGSNFQLNFQRRSGTKTDPHVIVLSAIDGTNLNADCECDPQETRQPILTISGIPGDENNDFKLLGSTCVEMTPVGNGLKVENPCSEPCCGCQELEVVHQATETLTGQVHTLINLAAKLEAAIGTLESNLATAGVITR